MTTTPASPGGLLARARWHKPEHVARRVERLVGQLETLPPLTPEQRDRLIAAIPPVGGEVAAA